MSKLVAESLYEWRNIKNIEDEIIEETNTEKNWFDNMISSNGLNENWFADMVAAIGSSSGGAADPKVREKVNKLLDEMISKVDSLTKEDFAKPEFTKIAEKYLRPTLVPTFIENAKRTEETKKFNAAELQKIIANPAQNAEKVKELLKSLKSAVTSGGKVIANVKIGSDGKLVNKGWIYVKG
mgnify:CR=1 FL=1